ncbi:hypothetical protein ff3pr_01197 [Weissella cibaria]|nr:hypothetical protein [Weissella cibaria]KIU23109.1 hypothetical protein ff3pr_01197 [Weissella cibaria]
MAYKELRNDGQKLADLADVRSADAVYQEWIEMGKKTYSHEEMWSRLLDD